MTYHAILEHNSWEGETWAWAFPATKAVERALARLAGHYRKHKVYADRVRHSASNIGREPSRFGIALGIDERFSAGHTSYLRPFSVVTDDEAYALELIEGEIASDKALCKGHFDRASRQEWKLRAKVATK